ncbi:flagellar basal body rod protein FlgB [Hoeflea sp. BAL378]|uniref:flagellar basal body rod protein FlgB n=1 Tax=Hoeflea sp. BAL378 TaxID=1547437 RepID=UPI000513E0C6|nr:flagellar basal body rod protein FlgB [Hoeflea sp. BAL378]KGF68522.1 flagellar basal body rod protein FlgB [Hoeflea sp. BAL378]
MQPIQLFDLTSKQAHWLTVRQSVVAGNIANANTPGYATREVAAFEAVLQETGARMAATHPGHIQEDALRGSVSSRDSRDVEVQPSGNSVNLPDELSKTGEIKRMYELNTGMVKAFHRMMLLTVRR